VGLLVESLKTVVGGCYLEYESQGRNVLFTGVFFMASSSTMVLFCRTSGRSSRHFKVDGTFTRVFVG
jgi:hypothetical protein